MMTTPRRRLLALFSACIGITAAVALIVTTSGADPLPSAVRLHLADDGDYFAYGTTTQPVTNSSGCRVGGASPLVAVSSGSGSFPGFVDDSLGVKTGGSNGTPCGQVDSSETLRLTRGSELGRRFTGLRLDVEMTGDARVRVVLGTGSQTATYELLTGTSITPAEAAEPDYDTIAPYLVSSSPGDTTDACASPQASGPNSGPNDNCLWTIQPGFSFDTFAITTLKGTVALEGSDDFGGSADFETLLYLENSAPTANTDSFTTNEDTPLSGNVLSNDSDPENDPLTATKLSDPTNGTVVFNSNGAFTYTPAADFHGTDSFTYRASDGVSNSGTATVNITITSVNDPPVPTTDGATTNEDESVVITVATDVDSDGGTADCALTDEAGDPLDGDIIDGGDFSVTVTPPQDFFGTMTLTCTVTDDEGATSTTETVIVVGVDSVNDAPVAVDDTADVDENTSAEPTFVDIDVVANDQDVEGDPLSAVEIGSVLPAGASAVLNLDGTVRYTPPEDYTGAGSFTYKADDGELTSANAATVSITVFAVICTTETVEDEDGGVSGSFTRLTDTEECKRYTVEADADDETVRFVPSGGATVAYRGVVEFPAEDPDPDLTGKYPVGLLYDPTGGTTYQPVKWCIAPQFDEDGVVTTALLPEGESWCIASAYLTGDGVGDVFTVWQVYGEDDPRFTR